jgi:DnaD/phage-associated family protein
MEGFAGFADGKLKVTQVPEPFFGELLPLIDDLAELKVTLHCLWLYRQPGRDAPYVSAEELIEDELLGRSLRAALDPKQAARPYASEETAVRDVLRHALELAVARGTLLQVSAQGDQEQAQAWYFLNSESGRAAVARVQRGEWAPEGAGRIEQLSARRPNIYNLYEQNLGLIHSPLLAEELLDAEQTYPAEWIEEAFRIAVTQNVRRWAYVRRILERWSQEGRGESPSRAPRPALRKDRPPCGKNDHRGLFVE